MTAGTGAAIAIDQQQRSHRQLFLMLTGLYLVQGIPVGLAFQAFPALMRDAGASLELVALVPAAALPWVLKFFWAPWVENHWSSRLGRRRSWLIPLQLLCALTLTAMAIMPLDSGAAGPMLVMIGVLAMVSSTQDISTDGLATERLSGKRKCGDIGTAINSAVGPQLFWCGDNRHMRGPEKAIVFHHLLQGRRAVPFGDPNRFIELPAADRTAVFIFTAIALGKINIRRLHTLLSRF